METKWSQMEGWKDQRKNYIDRSICFKCIEVHLCDFPVHQHHRFGDNGALCGCHSIQYKRSNTDSEWSQKNDVTTVACRFNKEVPFTMGRSEVRLKPEGNSVFEEPQITHTHILTLIMWHCWAHFSENVNFAQGEVQKHFQHSNLISVSNCFCLSKLNSSDFVTESKYLVLTNNNFR